MTETVREVVPSPCVSICALDEDDICVGCFRTGNEISYWGRLDADGQREVLRRCNERMQGKMIDCLVQTVGRPA